MTILAQDLINAIAAELSDETFVTWTEADLTGYLNSALRQLVLVRPDVSSSTENITLNPGTKQSIPITALRLLDIVRNMGADGATPGKPIWSIPEKTLNSYRPTWHSETGKSVIKNFVYDEDEPKTFYTYPPVHAVTTVIVEAKFSVMPAEITDVTVDSIPVDDVYEGPLREWMLYRAYSKETDSTESRDLARQHEKSFYQSLGIKTQVDVKLSPSKEVLVQ